MNGKRLLVGTVNIDNEKCYLYINLLDFSFEVKTESEKLAKKIKNCLKQKNLYRGEK